ncbi:MAG: CAP domain-containing protein [Polyangiales bacterium]
MSLRSCLSFVLLLGLFTGCGDDDAPGDSGPGADSGPRSDSGPRMDSGPQMDAGPGFDAGIEMPAHCADGPLEAPLPPADCQLDALPSTGDVAEDCVQRINQFRRECQCLPPLERWREGESCAAMHAEYDADGRGAHAGFRDRICENGGRGQNECPGYPSEGSIINGCLQQMWDEGPGEPFSEHGHYINMSNPAHSRVACGQFVTAEGRVWAIQNFR